MSRELSKLTRRHPAGVERDLLNRVKQSALAQTVCNKLLSVHRNGRNPRATKAIGYVRASTDEQETTLLARPRSWRAYRALRGLELVEIVDRCRRVRLGTAGQRPAGCRVAEALSCTRPARRRAKLDRLFRDAVDALAQTRAWDKAGIALHLCDMGGGSVDTSSPMGRMVLNMLAGVAEFERALIAERTRTALAAHEGPGRRVGAVPYGSRLAADGKHLEPDPAEQLVIAQARNSGRPGIPCVRSAPS